MKTLIALAFTILAAALAASPAIAAPMNGLYVAADYNYVSADHVTLNGGDAGFGYRFSRCFDAEAGFTHWAYESEAANGGYLDLTGHIYFTRTGRFSLFGSAGGDFINAFGSGKFGGRAGAGFEYRFSDRWSLRLGARYQTAQKDGIVGNAGITVSL